MRTTYSTSVTSNGHKHSLILHHTIHAGNLALQTSVGREEDLLTIAAILEFFNELGRKVVIKCRLDGLSIVLQK